MGGADIIPGISGGTMALVLGIYERLVTAISHFDLTLLAHLRRKNWAAAAEHLDLRFLVALGSGILLGVASLAGLMHFLLEHHGLQTWSFLFGLILASAILVGIMVERWTPACLLAAAAGAVFAFWLVGQLPARPPDGYAYLFLCGAIAICAMILPGISGAFILVLMGMYFPIIGVLKELAKGHVDGEKLAMVAVFCLGCTVGLLSFSKALRWLLNRYEALTMAVMCGVLVGSLRKIWPFKHELTTEEVVALGLPAEQAEKLGKYRLGDNYLPETLNGEVLLTILLAVVGLVLVLVLDRLTRGHEHVPPLEAADHEPQGEGY